MSEQIKPGDLIRDNDPRMPNRVLIVGRLACHHSGRDYVFCQDRSYPSRGYRICTDRIYTDGKPRRSGFSLLPAPPGPES